MGQNTTKFVICFYFKLTACFGPCSGPSSGHRSIYSRKLYSMSHKIYQSEIQRDLEFYIYIFYDLYFMTIKYINLKFKEILLNFRLIYFMTYIV